MIPQIHPRDAAQLLAGAIPPLLLDVREENEHTFASLPHSVLIPLGELHGRIGEIEEWKDKEVLVMCHHGLRSQHAISHLREAGFTRLRNVKGGIDLWSQSVDPGIPRY